MLTRLRDLLSRPGAGCEDLELPELSLTKPARAFQINVEHERFGDRSPIVYLQEPIAEFFIVVATDVNGCPWYSFSGRGLPFAQRDIVSPFPYARLPPLPQGATITAIGQDYKAIRPWIMITDEASFVRENTVLWVGLGAYTGIHADDDCRRPRLRRLRRQPRRIGVCLLLCRVAGLAGAEFWSW